MFAARIQQHLARYGISLRDLVWQTDNGGEFKGDFPSALLDSQHVRIPPAAHTYQSDVETVHRLEEDEFFDLESFASRGDFLAKTHTYQLYFNLVRTNSHKENLSPWQIIERLAPRSPLELCLLPPVFLDYYLNDSGGYDVPRLPYSAGVTAPAIIVRARYFRTLCYGYSRWPTPPTSTTLADSRLHARAGFGGQLPPFPRQIVRSVRLAVPVVRKAPEEVQRHFLGMLYCALVRRITAQDVASETAFPN